MLCASIRGSQAQEAEMNALFTPRELELLVRQEFKKRYNETPDDMIVQIMRAPGGSWLPECRFRNDE
jgi:hypothetical protein